jgi:hypothetical protein
MPTPVTVTCAAIHDGRIERLGGMHDGKPWSMAIGAVVAELGRPADQRQWDFVVSAHGRTAPLAVNGAGVVAPGVDLLSLPECPPQQLDGT